ncbi:hypothetical protein AA313_de0205296 [Arthrobotrys entomopaga]|nr:hypothetical protein AA313_de0205296 [Arthrobotrys entomopaga]
MPTLLFLPPEVLGLVCDQVACLYGPSDVPYFDPVPATGDLAALSRTCKLLHRIVDPILYRCIPTDRKFYCLFRTLITRKDLASYVRRAYMGELNDGETLEPLYEEREAMKRLARQLSHDMDGNMRSSTSGSVEWLMKDPFQVADLEQEHDDENEVGKLFLALTLLLLPNLEYLDYTVCYNYELEANLYAPNHFQYLTEILFKHSDTENGINLEDINGVLAAAPNVRVLRGHLIAGVGNVFCHKSVRELHLGFSSVDADGLMLIMKSFPFLEVFTYESGGCMVRDDEAKPCDFTEALLQRKDTLRHISIDFSYPDNIEEAGDALQSLQSMEVLETLTVDISTIYAKTEEESTTDGNLIINLLPSSIKSFSLRFVDPHAHLRQDFLKLAQVAPKRFPNLKRVLVPGGDPTFYEELKKAFEFT